MRVLVTGGLGYIGSHTVVDLLNNKNDVCIVDNLSNSSIDVLSKIRELTKRKVDFYKLDLAEKESLDLIKDEHFDAVIHFAGFKSVGESLARPLIYYANNLFSTINIINFCMENNINNFIFSSSATVYGNNVSPMNEDMSLKPTTNPYGETKAICERILQDAVEANDCFNVTILRYFNPVGAHESGLIGENPTGVPNNIMPYITQVAAGLRNKLSIFGDDYETSDGTGVRDYIHVMDLAEAHVVALNRIKKGLNVYNVGTGKGYSVMEIIRKFEEVNNVVIPYQVTRRRSGDLAICFANPSKIENELDWRAKRNMDDIVRDSWNFEKKLRNL